MQCSEENAMNIPYWFIFCWFTHLFATNFNNKKSILFCHAKHLTLCLTLTFISDGGDDFTITSWLFQPFKMRLRKTTSSIDVENLFFTFCFLFFHLCFCVLATMPNTNALFVFDLMKHWMAIWFSFVLVFMILGI